LANQKAKKETKVITMGVTVDRSGDSMTENPTRDHVRHTLMLVNPICRSPTNQFGEEPDTGKNTGGKQENDTTVEIDPQSDREKDNKTFVFPFSTVSLIRIDCQLIIQLGLPSGKDSIGLTVDLDSLSSCCEISHSIKFN
jgi:hypothetical protein